MDANFFGGSLSGTDSRRLICRWRARSRPPTSSRRRLLVAAMQGLEKHRPRDVARVVLSLAAGDRRRQSASFVVLQGISMSTFIAAKAIGAQHGVCVIAEPRNVTPHPIGARDRDDLSHGRAEHPGKMSQWCRRSRGRG